MSVNVWVVGEPSAPGSYTGRQYDGDGNAGSTLSWGNTLYACDLDSSGRLYVAGARITGIYSHRVYDASLATVWQADHGAELRAIAARSDGGAFVGGFGPSSANHFRKYNNDGTVDWSKSLSPLITGVACDGSDYGYAVRETTTTALHKYNVSGTEQWSKSHGANLYCVAVDASGNVYIGGGVSSSVTTRKYNSGGTQQWTANHGAIVRGIAVDASGNVYTTGNTSSSITTRKYNSSGTQQWTADHGGTCYGIDVDASGNVYVVGNGSLKKYDSSGTEQWSKTHNGALYGVAVFETLGGLPPGLPIPLGLGVPQSVVSHTIGGLALPLGLGAVTASAPPLPPDLAALGDPVAIYRLYLSGNTLLELPLASFQCRRRAGAQSWIDVEIPQWIAALWADIAARADFKLALYAGALVGGAETIGSFLEAIVTERRYERDLMGGSIRLTGRLTETATTPATHALRGIVRSGRDGGKRFARAAIDFLVRPGDTVTDGAASWVVDSVSHFVGRGDAYMDVTEA